LRVYLREVLPNLLLSTATVVIFLGGTEGVCRLLESRQPPRVVAPYITPWENWEDGFYTVKSTAVGWPPWEDYNSEGLRDRERTVEKPEGVHRVICLGDSTTLGWGIRPEEAYPQVLEDLLESQGDRVEVLNVALGGWSTRQERIAYERIARKYHPDAVLLGICLNDVPELQNNLTRPPALVAALYRRSALVRRLVRAREREIADVLELFTEKDSPKVKDAFARLFEEVRKLREEARADGTSFAVLVFPFRLQVMPGAPPPTAQQAIGGFCKAEGIPFLDLLPALTEAGPEAYIDYDHFSPMGARVVAERVLSSDVVAPKSAASGGETASRYGAAASGSSVPELLARLEDRDPRQRAAAARALGNLGSAAESAVPKLVRRLDDPEPPIRAGAAWALGHVGPGAKAALLPLAARLRDGDASVRFRAEESLRRIGPDTEAVRRALIAVVEDPKSPGRAEAAAVLGRLGPAARSALGALVAALEDPRESVRGRAAWALGQIGPDARSAVPALLVAFKDAGIRWRVADALGAIGPSAVAAVPDLVASLQDPSSNVRWRAAEALGAIGPTASRAAVPGLLRALRDPFENVRLGAVVALGQVGADPAVAGPGYIRALGDEDGRVRARAARALGRLAPLPPEAVQALTRALQDENEWVRTEAGKALRKAGPAGR
jgi:HEAT repeat protein/lysophospholipase L1-like esterase